MKRTAKTAKKIALLVTMSCMAWASIGSADTPAEHRAIDEDHPGFEVYRRYCAVCHGVFADGKGPVAPALKTPPADLSRLSARFGSPLRADELAEFIDGRTMARSHGTSDMPVWGKHLYQGRGNNRLVDKVRRGTILRIIDYLDSIQVKADPD